MANNNFGKGIIISIFKLNLKNPFLKKNLMILWCKIQYINGGIKLRIFRLCPRDFASNCALDCNHGRKVL